MRSDLALVVCAGVILAILAGFTLAPQTATGMQEIQSILLSLLAGFLAGKRGRRRLDA